MIFLRILGTVLRFLVGATLGFLLGLLAAVGLSRR